MARIAEITVSRLVGPDSTPQLPFDEALRKTRLAHPNARFQEIQIPSGDLNLNAWMVKPPKSVPVKGTVLVLHDWADHRGRALENSSFLLGLGYQLFMFDARSALFVDHSDAFWGFLKEDLDDIARVIRYLASRDDVRLRRLAVYGCGWGGLKAILTGTRHKKIRAVIDDAGPLHYASMTVDYMNQMPPEARTDYARIRKFIEMVKAKISAKLGYDIEAFDPRVAVQSLSQPLLVIHSQDDTYVPISLSKEIFEAAPEPKAFLEGENFGHCEGVNRDPELYVPAVVEFLDKNIMSRRKRR